MISNNILSKRRTLTAIGLGMLVLTVVGWFLLQPRTHNTQGDRIGGQQPPQQYCNVPTDHIGVVKVPLLPAWQCGGVSSCDRVTTNIALARMGERDKSLAAQEAAERRGASKPVNCNED
jgi:hypothetical protein